MPYYQYRCVECGEEFDVRASVAEKSAGLEPECPTCHAKKTQQVITAGMLVRGSTDTGASSCCGPNAAPGCCG